MFLQIKIAVLRILGQNLETPLFVAVFLPEHYMEWFAQSTAIRNLIHASNFCFDRYSSSSGLIPKFDSHLYLWDSGLEIVQNNLHTILFMCAKISILIVGISFKSNSLDLRPKRKKKFTMATQTQTWIHFI